MREYRRTVVLPDGRTELSKCATAGDAVIMRAIAHPKGGHALIGLRACQGEPVIFSLALKMLGLCQHWSTAQEPGCLLFGHCGQEDMVLLAVNNDPEPNKPQPQENLDRLIEKTNAERFQVIVYEADFGEDCHPRDLRYEQVISILSGRSEEQVRTELDSVTVVAVQGELRARF